MKPRIHTIKMHAAPLAWLLAAMLLLFPVSQHALPGILLCIESDGTIEVENGRTGDCVPIVAQVRPEIHRTLDAVEIGDADAADCASCFDVLLLNSPADGQPAPRVKTTLQVDVKPAALVNLHPVQPPAFPPASSPFSESSPPLPPPALLRSVVLLI